LGQCCAVEGCNDCTGFDGASIEVTKTKYAEKTKDLMCQKCMPGSCFPPVDKGTGDGRLKCK
jgi:hypothetical protein